MHGFFFSLSVWLGCAACLMASSLIDEPGVHYTHGEIQYIIEKEPGIKKWFGRVSDL